MSQSITLLNGEEWKLNELLDNMSSDDFYYGYLDTTRCLSSSAIKNLIPNPKEFAISQEIKEQPSLQMKLGNVLHTKILEPTKFNDRFVVVDASTRNTNIYKAAEEENPEKICILVKENKSMDMCVDAVWKCGNAVELLDTPMKEVPNVFVYRGIPFRMKADTVNVKKNAIVDVKTTSDINSFRHSANMYNYDVQAFIYTQGFSIPNFYFLVVDKGNYTVGIAKATDDFLARGKQKLDSAIDIYERFFSSHSFEDVNDYFIDIEL